MMIQKYCCCLVFFLCVTGIVACRPNKIERLGQIHKSVSNSSSLPEASNSSKASLHKSSSHEEQAELSKVQLQPLIVDREWQHDCYRLPKMDLIRAQLGNDAYGGALQNCNEVIKGHPDCGYAYLYRATARSNLGQLERAVKDIENAVRLNPSNSDMRFVASRIHESAGQWQKAADDVTCEFVISGVKYCRPDLVRRARNYLNLGKDELAFQDLNSYFAAGRDGVAEAFYLRGLYYEHQRSYDKARSDYFRAANQLRAISGWPFHNPASPLYKKILAALKRVGFGPFGMWLYSRREIGNAPRHT